MRIFCGLTGDATTIAAAVVNERGGVIATSEVTDDAFGYLALCRMWVRHADILRVSVADLSDTRDLRRLAASAGQPTTTAQTVDVNSDDPLDKAVHIARMLSRGELHATIGTEEPAATCQLVGGLHTLARNAHAGHATLIELLRQTHPAALAAWGDPTETAALEVLRTALGGDAASATDPLPRSKPEPSRVKELALALERTQRAKKYQVEPRIAAAVAAAADSLLAAERACLALATGIDDQLAAPPVARPTRSRRRAPAAAEPEATPAPAAAPRSTRAERRSASEAPPPRARRRRASEPESEPTELPTPRRPRVADEMPTRKPVTRPEPEPHDEPVTAPLKPRAERPPVDEGFPLMPEPPKYVEPATAASPTTKPRAKAPSAPPVPETDLLSAPVSELPTGFDEADDDDLLIFSQARSAWFKGPAAIEDSEEAWNFPADEGWRAAEAASDNRRNAGETTPSGLPRRVPQANLVPGSAILSDAAPAPINRDATALASRTAGFFRGWSRARRETVGAGTGS